MSSGTPGVQSQQGREPSVPVLLALMSLTFSTGLVDAVSYLGLGHIFTANMTGNIVLIGFSLAGAPHLSLNGQFVSLVSFFLGATVGGRYLNSVLDEPKSSWLPRTAIVEAALLLVATGMAAAPELAVGVRTYEIVVLTAFAMGYRTAITRKLAYPDIVTTVLTLTLTGLASESWLAGGTSPRLRRRIFSLVLLFSGAATGAVLLRHGLVFALAASVACAVISAVCYFRMPASEE